MWPPLTAVLKLTCFSRLQKTSKPVVVEVVYIGNFWLVFDATCAGLANVDSLLMASTATGLLVFYNLGR